MVQEEQLNTFIFQLSLKKICSLRIQRIRQMAKKVIKYSISWCAAKALFSCPAIISQRLESRIISNEPLENTEEESRII
jgi:hypothetical protein